MKYSENDLVRIAKRENNNKRSYLVVDPLQGKHVPVSPRRAIALFCSLADELRGKYAGEKLLLVGFAETATAIGAQAAVSLETNYIQTTREKISGVEYLFFSEEHSHATEQKLVKDDMDLEIADTDRIVFVEDEVTTGNTVLNIIHVLKKQYPKKMKFAVASLLNGMSDEHLEAYKNEGIDLHYLVKTDHSKYGKIAGSYAGDGQYFSEKDLAEGDLTEGAPTEGDSTKSDPTEGDSTKSAPTKGDSTKGDPMEGASTEENFAGNEIHVKDIKGYMNTRRVVNAPKYEAACRKLSDEIAKDIKADRILVIGTEEFMFPALYTGKRLEEMGCEVRCHSTTRSPIAVSRESDYPLHTRYALRSLYDPDRATFLYNIESYDQVVVITDAALADEHGLQTLIAALRTKNSRINVYRWC